MSQPDILLSNLGLHEYIEPLVSHGFKTLDDLANISEERMEELNFKRGHRRKLQREIASYRGHPHTQPLPPLSMEGCLHEEGTSSYGEQSEGEFKDIRVLKRSYRRRPPRDPHAPQRPRSGYVLFANSLRQNQQISSLPFIDISKIVGIRWQSLSPEERAVWTSYAAEQRTVYKKALAEYQRHHDNPCKNENNDRVAYDGDVDTNGSSQPEYEPSEPFGANTILSEGSFRNGIRADQDWEYAALYQNKATVSLHTTNEDKGSKSFHIHAINPFRVVSKLIIWPLLETFLTHVNTIYYCVSAEHLVQQFASAVETAATLPNHIMYLLCFCISIGCQIHTAGSNETAIMWYENGRRYLDDDDWGCSLNAMRGLTLVCIFHQDERPTTARHYLDLAICIGEANKLSAVTEDGTIGSNEWINVWGTIQSLR